ncbi:MAG: hypothetical protein DBX37_05670 [Massilioclostridium sp.]|nr:MAG: hypothetical protein DBX37_05670 [Massilioclostridium sp.]
MKVGKALLSWIVAAILAFLIVNAICFLYERPVGWIDTPNGASLSIRRPGSIIVRGLEGYGITQVDDNGYINPDKPLNDSYILMMGASHTQGKEIRSELKYSYLVNEMIAEDSEFLSTYNIGCERNFLPTLLGHFKAAISEYPNASCITIEIGDTDYSGDEIREAMEQFDNIEASSISAEEYFDQADLLLKIKNVVKEYIPILSLIKNKLETAKEYDVQIEATEESTEFDYKEYQDELYNALLRVRQEYDGPIVFLYHPNIKLNEDGSLEIIRSKTWEIFRETCQRVDIDCVDLGNDFLEEFQKTFQVPYGFHNTTLGSGHLNVTGHRIIADAIMEYIGGIRK